MNIIIQEGVSLEVYNDVLYCTCLFTCPIEDLFRKAEHFHFQDITLDQISFKHSFYILNL